MQVGVRLGRNAAIRLVVIGLSLVVAACGGSAASVGPGGSGASVGTGGSVGPGGSVAAVSVAPTLASGSPAASTDAATAAVSGAPTPKPVAAVKGTGFVDSKTFTLKAGNYVVRWTITSAVAAGCTAIGAIHSPDGQISVEIANTKVSGKASRSGSKSAPKLTAGIYLVTFATTCTWTAQVYKA